MASKYTPKEVSTDLDGILAVMTKYPTFKIGDKVLKPDEKEWNLADTKALKKSLDDDLKKREELERDLATGKRGQAKKKEIDSRGTATRRRAVRIPPLLCEHRVRGRVGVPPAARRILRSASEVEDGFIREGTSVLLCEHRVGYPARRAGCPPYPAPLLSPNDASIYW